MYQLNYDGNFFHVLKDNLEIASFSNSISSHMINNTGSGNYFVAGSAVTFNPSDNPQLFTTSSFWIQRGNVQALCNVLNTIDSNFVYYLPTADSSTIYVKLRDNLQSINVNYFSLCTAFVFLNILQDFDTNLYPELIDNSETASMLNTWVNDGDISGWTSDDKQVMELIEKYNKNVLLLRSTRKVEIDKEISLASDSSTDVDLTPVVQQLSNINNKLQTTEQIDNTQKSITDVLNQQANTIQVDEIGLLRSKKGYY